MKSGLFSFFWLLPTAALAQGVFVQPNAIYTTIAAGAEARTAIKVTCAEHAGERLRVDVVAFSLDVSGTPVPSRAEEHAIDVAERDVTLDANGKAEVEVRLHERGEHASFWSAVRIEMDSPQPGPRVAVVVPVFVTVEGTESPRLEVESMNAVWSNGGITVTAMLHNTGNVVLRLPVTFAIERGADELASDETPPVVILPGARRVVEARLAVAGGNAPALMASALVRFMSDAHAEGRCKIDVPVRKAAAGV